MMNRETLAEVICNLAGQDPNNEAHWQAALKDADNQLAAAARGEQEPWWEGDDE